MFLTRAADLLWLPADYVFGDGLGVVKNPQPCSRLAAFAPTASQARRADH